MPESYPVKEIRSSFPILKESNRGKPLAYLDNAASSQKPQIVIDSLSTFYAKNNSNVHRGIYELAEKAESQYVQARNTIAEWFSVSPNELIFVRGTTEAINLVAQSFGSMILKPDDHIILSEMEHHANIVPWQLACEKIGSKVKVCPILPDGSLDRSVLTELLKDPASKILSICHVSNTLGTSNPLTEIIKESKELLITELTWKLWIVIFSPFPAIRSLARWALAYFTAKLNYSNKWRLTRAEET